MCVLAGGGGGRGEECGASNRDHWSQLMEIPVIGT